MSKTVSALTFILCLNLMFFLIQTSMDTTANEYTNGTTNKIFNYDGSMIQQYDAGNYTLNETITTELPAGDSSVSPTTGNIFTDAFTTLKGWLLDIPGMKYFVAIANALPHFLKTIGLPNQFVYAIGFLWHALTIFLIILLFFGEN